MRYRWTALAAVALAGTVAGALATALPASAALVTSCVGEASGVTVPNDLFVPAGESCELTDVVINGNTTVRAGANLMITNSTLNGTLALQSDGFTNSVGSSVSGATRLSSAFGLYAESSTLTGAVTVTDSGFFYGLGSSLTAVTSTNGETYLESVRVAKDVTTTGDLLSDVYNSVIQGAVKVTGASLGSVVCVSEIDGNAAFAGSGAGDGAVLQIGAAAPLPGCGFDVFAANLAVTDNTAPSYVSDNVVRGTVTCTGNTPATVGTSARIRGQAVGQCAPGAAASAAKNAAAAPSTTRQSDLRAKVAGRVAAGQSTAARTGQAKLARQ
jgi:hypothetical protein